MAQSVKNQPAVRTRSMEEIEADFAAITDPGELRLNQARLAHEALAHLDKKDIGDAKKTFAKGVSKRLEARNANGVSTPVIDNLLSTWKYIVSANAPQSGEVANAAYNLASQGIAKKDETYVQPAIAKIIAGADPVDTFVAAKKAIDEQKKVNKAAAEAKKSKETDAQDADGTVSFDAIIRSLGMVTEEYFGGLSDENKTILSTAIAAVIDVVR